MTVQTKESLEKITPGMALEMLKEGNRRFVENKRKTRDLSMQTVQTSDGQYPYAVVFGCVDSRVPVELVFDLGIGDTFAIRVAGNVVNEDVLGSMEFATKVVGSKHILVLGHTNCGAIQGAVEGLELGNLTEILKKIQPAVEAVKHTSDGDVDINQVAEMNVRLMMAQITERSPVLNEMVKDGRISISGGMYDVASGIVTFLE